VGASKLSIFLREHPQQMRAEHDGHVLERTGCVHSKVAASTRQRIRCKDKSAVLCGSFKNDAVLC
jgi:hypothetical protein